MADGGGNYFGAEEEIRKLPEEFKEALLKQIEASSRGKPVEAITIPRTELEKAGWLTEDAAKALAEEEAESIHDEERKNIIRPKTPKPVGVPSSRREQVLLEGRITRLEEMMEHMIANFPEKSALNCENCPLRAVADKVLDKTLEKI